MLLISPGFSPEPLFFRDQEESMVSVASGRTATVAASGRVVGVTMFLKLLMIFSFDLYIVLRKIFILMILKSKQELEIQ